MNIMLTEKAANRLQEIIQSKGEDLALRVMVKGGGCSGLEYGMALERNPQSDDNVLKTQGVTVVIDPGSREFLEGSTIDYVDSLMGGGFAINNPNAVSSCGCGQSFRTADKTGAAKSCHSGSD